MQSISAHHRTYWEKERPTRESRTSFSWNRVNPAQWTVGIIHRPRFQSAAVLALSGSWKRDKIFPHAEHIHEATQYREEDMGEKIALYGQPGPANTVAGRTATNILIILLSHALHTYILRRWWWKGSAPPKRGLISNGWFIRVDNTARPSLIKRVRARDDDYLETARLSTSCRHSINNSLIPSAVSLNTTFPGVCAYFLCLHCKDFTYFLNQLVEIQWRLGERNVLIGFSILSVPLHGAFMDFSTTEF